jgi:tetratricopeptide (TPR) repeat protein
MTEALERALQAGETALASGDMAAATSAFEAAWHEAPDSVPLALALANVHRLRDSLVTQREVLERAFATGDWSEEQVAYALGSALLEVGAADAALRCFNAVRARRPRDPAVLGALAAAHRVNGEASRAWPFIREALQLAPGTAAHLLIAAQVRHELGDLPGAEDWLDKAERARPDHAPTRVQRAYTSLLRGPSAAGWALFESRPLPEPATGAAPWRGEPLREQSIVVTAEQGVGDQFQFLRFLAALKERGAGHVVVECHAHAVSLLQANGIEAVPRGTAPITAYHVPLMSLPHRCGLGAAVFGERVPYLRSPLHRTASTAAGTTPRRRLGLVWAGNPAFPGRGTRDFDPALLPLLVDSADVEWISLQQGVAGADAPPGVRQAGALPDWAATAALLQELDGLVTTDTGIAHLAGAMGVPTWVLLQKVPDWRWGLSGTTTPWYPTLTLVRQPQPGDWRGVVERLAQALRSG